MNDEEFENIIKKAVEGIPSEFKEKLENVSIVYADYPNEAQMRTLTKNGKGGFLLGLYQGIPQTKRGVYGIGGPLPDKITIFKYPLLSISRNYNEAVENIRKTVIHEIAHHFGLSEEELKKTRVR